MRLCLMIYIIHARSSRPDMFLGSVLKICSKFKGEQPCRNAISIELLCNFIESHFSMGILLKICCIFSEHLLLRIPLEGFFWKTVSFLNEIFGGLDCIKILVRTLTEWFRKLLKWYSFPNVSISCSSVVNYFNFYVICTFNGK